MKVYVGVTDSDWFKFLRTQPGMDEVNFWQPSGGRRFAALGVGDLLLFKLHYPTNMIVGGGTFVSFDSFPAWLVWEAFEEKNGAASYAEMCTRIERYRREKMSVAGTEPVGCIILGDPFFLDERDWINPPHGWAPNIVQGKTYDGSVGEGRALVEQVMSRRSALMFADEAMPLGIVAGVDGPTHGDPALARRRLGQGAFRLLVTDAYDRRCAVSGEKALPVLQSAHILPVSHGGQHRVDNGLLLRSDIHTLFDRGYVTITPDGRFLASRRLKTDYNNGDPYYAMESRPVSLPAAKAAQPSHEFLEWHNQSIYLG